MNSFKAIQEINKVETLLNAAGLQDHVEITVETANNQYDKRTPHMVATIKTGMNVEVINDQLNFTKSENVKYDELNNYFSAEIFASGITQRADYIKAPLAEKVFCYHNNIHPSRYEAPVAAPVKPSQNNKYTNGYQDKINILETLLNGANQMGDTRQINYYTKKINYFSSRQEEYLTKNN